MRCPTGGRHSELEVLKTACLSYVPVDTSWHESVTAICAAGIHEDHVKVEAMDLTEELVLADVPS